MKTPLRSRSALLLSLLGFAVAANPQTPSQAVEQWRLLSREGGCADVTVLRRKFPDLGAVADPAAFAAFVQRKGLKVSTKALPVPSGGAVEVLVPERELGVVFVTAEYCRTNGSDRR